MIAYKLFRERKDGTLSPLFINRKQIIPIGNWLFAISYPTKGFKERPGWHCTHKPYAPHLKSEPKNEKRVWCEVEIDYFSLNKRPESQGGIWYLAKWMKVNRKLSSEEIAVILSK